jgi:hypothetical protein
VPVAYVRCEARLEGPLYKVNEETGEKTLKAGGWRNEDGSTKPGGIYGNVDELYRDWGLNPDNESTDGLQSSFTEGEKLWVINQSGQNLTYDINWAPRADISLPVLQCIFPSISRTVQCRAHRTGKYNFLKVKEIVHAKTKDGAESCCHTTAIKRCTTCVIIPLFGHYSLI